MTQLGPGDSMVAWVTNFGVQIGLEALTPTKIEFCEIQPLLLLLGGGADVKTGFQAQLGFIW